MEDAKEAVDWIAVALAATTLAAIARVLLLRIQHQKDHRDMLTEIRKLIALPRQHASYFNWHDKPQKEKGIVQDFLKYWKIHSFTDLEMTADGADPPDAWVFDSVGERTALEITELVNQSAIDAQIRSNRTYNEEREKWSDFEYFQDSVNKRVMEKDNKCDKIFSDGHTAHLLLHSDEDYIDAFYRKHLASGFQLTGTRFQMVWLLLGYNPYKKTTPLVRLTEPLEFWPVESG